MKGVSLRGPVRDPGRRRPLLLFAAGAAVVSFTGPIIKLLMVAPTVTAFYRMVFGGAILLLLVLLQRRQMAADRATLLAAGAAGLAFACDMAMWNRSIRLVGPGLATILVGFQVFFLAGFAFVTGRERPNWRILAAIPLAIIGLLLIVGVEWRLAGAGYRWGVVFGLGSAACYTVYLLALRRLQCCDDFAGRMANLTLVTLLCAGFLGIIALIQRESFAIPDGRSLGLLVLLGIIGQVIAWVLLSAGLPKLRHSLVGLVLLLQPLLASVWDVLFFHRPATPVQILGAVLALAAIYLGTTASSA